MSLVPIPNTFAGGTLDLTKLDANFAGIYNDHNGNITGDNIAPDADIPGTALGDASTPLDKLETPVPETGTAGYKIACGTKSFVVTAGGGVAIIDVAIAFSEADGGEPGFTVAPRVVGQFRAGEGAQGQVQRQPGAVYSVTNEGFGFTMNDIAQAGTNVTYYVDWIAMGA